MPLVLIWEQCCLQTPLQMALLHARLLQTGHGAVSAADGSSLITRDHACSWLSQPPQSQLVSSFKPQTELSSSFSSELFVYGIPEVNVQINKVMPIRKYLPNGGRCQVRDARPTHNNLLFIPREIRGTPQRKMPGSLTDRSGLETVRILTNHNTNTVLCSHPNLL